MNLQKTGAAQSNRRGLSFFMLMYFICEVNCSYVTPQCDNEFCGDLKNREWAANLRQTGLDRMIERGREEGKVSKSLEKVMQLWTMEG